MKPAMSPRSWRRRLRLVRCALLPLLALAATSVCAQEELREFATLVRALPAAPRGQPVDALAWERRTRAADRLGPSVLGEADVALLAAARAGRWATVSELVMGGTANPNARDETGGNTLGWAARAGQDDVVRLLLKRGAQTERLGEDGFTPLGAAAFFGHRSTVRLLLKAGADPRTRSASGQTPMHLAASSGRVGVIDELLAAGVDPTARNRDGDKALDVAANRGRQDVMARLIAAGVDPNESGR